VLYEVRVTGTESSAAKKKKRYSTPASPRPMKRDPSHT